MFEILDEELHQGFSGMTLTQAMKWGKNKWSCVTEIGYFMEVEIKDGIVHMKLAETEYDLTKYDNEVLKITPPPDRQSLWIMYADMITVKFKDVMDFMKWTCGSDQIWDQ